MGREAVGVDRFGRTAGLVSVVGAVLCAAVVVSTFVADEPVVPAAVTGLVALGVFPVHIVTVLRLKASGRSVGDVLREARRSRFAPPLGAAFFLFWLAAMTAIFGNAGSVETHDGRYYLSDHGDLTEISREEYDDRRSASLRLIAAGPGGLYVAGVGAWQLLGDNRQTSDPAEARR